MENLNFDEKVLKKQIRERIIFRMNTIVQKNSIEENSIGSKFQPMIDHHNILEVQYITNRKLIGKFIILLKKIARKLMYPILIKQIVFNQKVIDQLYIVDQRNIEIEHKFDSKIKEMTNTIIDDIVDEFSGVIKGIIEENNNTRLRVQEYEMKVQEYEMRVQEYQNEMKLNCQELTRDSVTTLLDELADLEQGNGNYERSYHLLLMAQRKSPDNLEIETKLLQSFDRMIRSRND